MAQNTAHNGPDPTDVVTILPYILVPPDELQATMREGKEMAEVEGQRHVEEKVEEWTKKSSLDNLHVLLLQPSKHESFCGLSLTFEMCGHL